MTGPPTQFDCVECGGVAHLLGTVPADVYIEEGTSFSYRCSDCNDRFDVIWEPGDGDS